ncbi:glycosyltransferase family 39 protein [Candidatus Bathyarchaeota archaeon]|nr:glycosyltransferase family 39 protein [Candidatus Bathyarchaeota archaeon]
MIVNSGNLEKYVIVFLSIFFLLTSTLTFAPIKMALGLRLVYILVISSLLSLCLSWLFDKKTHGRVSTSAERASSFRMDVILIVILFVLSFLTLSFRAILNWQLIKVDEPMHLIFTREVYLTISNSNYDYLIKLAYGLRDRANPAFPSLNPIFPYLLTVALIPYSEFSLFSGRILNSAISSLVPVVTYFILRDLSVSRKFSALTALAVLFSALFQSHAYLYIFDGLSTLLFTVAFFLMVKGIRKEGAKYFYLSGIFFCILLSTKYPPATWLLITYFLAVISLIIWKGWQAKKALTLVVIPSIAATFIFIIFFRNVFELLKLVFLGWRAETSYYVQTTIWDLAFVFGWAPYAINGVMAYRLLRSKERDVVKLVSLVVMLLAFLTLVPYLPVTRRIIQVIPVIFATTVAYASDHYPSAVTVLVVMNLSWWGLLSFLSCCIV